MNTTYMVSAAFCTDGPIRTISYQDEYEIIFVEEGELELHIPVGGGE